MIQVGKVTCDNTASMVSAFQLDNDPVPLVSQTGEELKMLPSNEEDQNDENLYVDLGEGEELDQLIEDIFDSSDHFKLERNPCLSHLLQLAIKDAIQENLPAKKMIERVNGIVGFFHKNTHYYTALRECNGNLSLLKPCITRWNAQHDSLKRLVHKKPNKVRYKISSSHGWNNTY